ncbi:hypothetical protein L195_g038507 [Trifolium pratense]|uniref:Uncharacterized protein n=1 Tax=Trifolium pratense TaxID=57577 RepID=A0A2K3LVB7_TRIPR|nr:hypothetical protein L195_g038507 [Trifolium pratense]
MAHSDSHLDAADFRKRQKKIYAACSSLFHLGFDRKLFTIKNIYKHGYTEDQFLELIKPLSSIPGMDEINLFHISCNAELSNAKLAPYNFTTFLNFTEWLYQEDGKSTLEFLSNKNKKKNIVRKELTTAEVSLARMFIEYGASHKLERDRIGGEIVESSKQQMKMEMEYASIVEELERNGNVVYKHESEVREENSDGRKVTIIYKFEPDVSEKISNVPPLPDNSKKAPKQKAKAKRQEEQEYKRAAKKMKSVTLG